MFVLYAVHVRTSTAQRRCVGGNDRFKSDMLWLTVDMGCV